MCGDMNAHHYSWETMARETPRGKALHEWFEEQLLEPSNGRGPTRAARFEQGLTGFSAPDLSIRAVFSLHPFSREPLHELNSDRLPLLIR